MANWLAAGVGQGMIDVAQQGYKEANMQKESDLATERALMLEHYKEQVINRKRDSFVSEIDKTRAGKLGADGQNLDKAAEIYRNTEGMTDADRQAGLTAVDQARNRLGKLTPEEIGMAGLRTGNLDAKDYISTTSRAETTADKMERLMAMKLMQEDRRDGRQEKGIDSRESIAADRIEAQDRRTAAAGGQRTTLAQTAHNREIDAARRIVGSLDPTEIQKRTAKFTDTGRDNPNYDPQLAVRVRIASKRKVGDDDWYDQQNPEAPAPSLAPTQPQGPGVTDRFAADPAMKSYKMGKTTDRGVEVLDASGKLLGHYK